MTAFMLAMVFVWPLLLALLFTGQNLRPLGQRLVMTAPWPGLLAALFLPADAEVIIPWLLLGGWWQLDDLARGFLGFSALLWTLGSWYALHYLHDDANKGRFQLFWLLTLAGNMGLILCRDIAGFYTFFALMTFAGYGLVVHTGSDAAHRAGRIYLIMALLGEMMILSGLLLAAGAAGSLFIPELAAAISDQPLIILLLFFGFGVKAGLPLLHMWLPLAHPVAPTPASAVLSGAMIKAGLLAWLLLLPLGVASSPLGQPIMLMGLFAALAAALIGITQQNAKTVLAYSSVSQMGLMTLMVGATLAMPQIRDAMLAAIVLYALHHGLAKGALFLVANALPANQWRGYYWLLPLIPSLSLAGLPLTSGAQAKLAMKGALVADPTAQLWSWLPLLLSFAALGTSLLMIRFLWCLKTADKPVAAVQHLPLITAIAVLCSLTGWLWLPGGVQLTLHWPEIMKWLALLWPIVAAIALSVTALKLNLRAPTIPAGDIVVIPEQITRTLLCHAQQQGRVLGDAIDRLQQRLLTLGRTLMHKLTEMLRQEDYWRQDGPLLFASMAVLLTAALVGVIL